MINKTLLKASAAAYGVNLNDTALDRFDKYAEELIAWNEKINLTAITEPDEIVMTIDGKPVSWNDYMYFYQGQASQLEQQFQMYQAYGMALGWNSIADEEGHTYAELMGQSTEDTLRQLFAVEGLAEDEARSLADELSRRYGKPVAFDPPSVPLEKFFAEAVGAARG